VVVTECHWSIGFPRKWKKVGVLRYQLTSASYQLCYYDLWISMIYYGYLWISMDPYLEGSKADITGHHLSVAQLRFTSPGKKTSRKRILKPCFDCPGQCV
jgi:hypothetical protein